MSDIDGWTVTTFMFGLVAAMYRIEIHFLRKALAEKGRHEERPGLF